MRQRETCLAHASEPGQRHQPVRAEAVDDPSECRSNEVPISWNAEGEGATLQVHVPEIIRNGEFLEMLRSVFAVCATYAIVVFVWYFVVGPIPSLVPVAVISVGAVAGSAPPC